MAITPQDPHKAIITSVGFATGGGTANGTKPVITGTADAGTTVDIFDGVRIIGTAIVAANGTWSFTPTTDLKAGSHSFTAISVASNGDFGASSTPMSVTVPSSTPVGPAKPVINGMTDDSGHAILPTTPTNDPHPSMSGTGSPGDTVTMYDGTTPIGSAIIDGTGHWVVQPTKDLGPGSHDIYVVETNPAGVPSVPSDHYPVVIDTSVPGTPSTPTMTDGTGADIPAGSTTNFSTPHISGAGHAGDTITVYDGATVLGTAKVDTTGSWTFTPSPPLSGGSLSVTESNAAGESAHSAAVGFTTSVPTITITGLYDYNHNLIPENGSTTGAVTIEGTLSGYADGDKVALVFVGPATNTYYARCELFATVVEGKFSMTVSSDTRADPVFFSNPLFAGTGSFTVTALLLHSNSKTYASSATYTITETNWISADTPATPAVPTLTDDTGANIPAGGATSVSTPHISGAGHAGDTILVFDGAATLGTATVGADGKWTFMPAPLSSGSHSISVTESNAAGVGEHDAFVGNVANGNEIVDLNANPESYFKETTAHIQGSTVHPVETGVVAPNTAPAVTTLHLTGDHQILDLTSLTGKTAAAKISGIEVIDLGGHENSVKLSLTDVLNLGEQDLFIKDGKQQMMINGSDGDKVDLSNAHIAGVADGQWQQEGTTVVGGVTYNVYEHSGAHTELLVQQGVQIVVH